MQFTFDESEPLVRVKVVGVGGAGGNAINHMIESGLTGVDFIAANTDLQDLNTSKAEFRLQLGPNVTGGRGAGAMPAKGKDAAMESSDDIRRYLQNADMVFITSGMGGGTGTGAAPVIAKISKELGALTVAVVTKPFRVEGAKRMRVAEEGWCNLKEYVDTIITISNNRLSQVMEDDSTMDAVFAKANDILCEAVRGITDLVNHPGEISLDFADLQTVMQEVGPAVMGAGVADGDNRAVEAAKRAIDNPLLEDVGIDGARGVVMNIAATRETLKLKEFIAAAETIQARLHEDATVCLGMSYDPSLGESLRVTVVATGIHEQETPGLTTDIRTLRRLRSEGKNQPGEKHLNDITDQPKPPRKRWQTRLPMDDTDHWDQPAYIRKAAD